MISGKTTLIAHLGFPTTTFKAPMIYNPYFEDAGIDAVVMPMGVQADDYPAFLAQLFRVTNLRGALVTMPHKVTTVSLADEITPTAANAVTTVTSATSVTCVPMDRRASARCPTTPMAVVNMAAPATHSVMYVRSLAATCGMTSASCPIMPAPARSGSRRPRR